MDTTRALAYHPGIALPEPSMAANAVPAGASGTCHRIWLQAITGVVL
jgi:hypothetical protein